MRAAPPLFVVLAGIGVTLGAPSAGLTGPGRQSLTLYVAHILLGMGMLEPLGLLNGALTARRIMVTGLGFCVFRSLYAMIWGRAFRRGPLEATMRRISD
ncbi:MAG: DUF418 domain-containing protein [Ruegeria sp.]